MRSPKAIAVIAVSLVLVATIVTFFGRESSAAAPLVGVVRATEVQVQPEVTGQLVSVSVEKGAQVHAGDIVAKLSAVELTAQVAQARAALAAATANRNNVYAGVRREQVESLKNEIAKAVARRDFLELQLTRASTLAGQNFESQQTLDQAENDAAGARADVAAAAGPTREERGIADAEVEAARAALAVLERHLDKTILRAPADGVLSVIAAEIGENVREIGR